MKALGYFAGIGAMLIPAKEQGSEILGNIETRKIHCYRDTKGLNTFEQNFKAQKTVFSYYCCKLFFKSN